MQNTLQGLGSWLVKVAVLGSMTLWGISNWPIVSAQTVSPGGFDFVVINSGTRAPAGFIGLADVVVTYENHRNNWTKGKQPYC